MTNKQFKLLKRIFQLNQEELRLSTQKFLNKHYGIKNVFATKSFVYAEGDIPICLVAHLDTVHKTLPINIFYDEKQDIMWSPQGLGADDRAGVFSILQIIKDGYKPHVVFTTDEEIGCIGARSLAKARKRSPFKDCHFLIELDRRGTDDCVFYELDNEEFEKFIEGYGFQSEFGTYSDICEIAPVWGCAAVNLSIGYMNEHTIAEMLSPICMFRTIERVEKILKDAKDGKTKFYKYIPMTNYYKYYGRYGYYWDNDDDYQYPIPSNKKENDKDGVCYWCMGRFNEKELISVRSSDGYIDYYCPECYEKYLNVLDYNNEGERKDV